MISHISHGLAVGFAKVFKEELLTARETLMIATADGPQLWYDAAKDSSADFQILKMSIW